MTVDLDRLEALAEERIEIAPMTRLGEFEGAMLPLISELRAARERIAELEAVAAAALFSIETFEKLRMPDWNGAVDPDSVLGRLRAVLSAETSPPPQPRVTDEMVAAALTSRFRSEAWKKWPTADIEYFQREARAALEAAIMAMGGGSHE